MKKLKNEKVAGTLDIEKWTDSQFIITITNRTSKISETIALDVDALDELIVILHDMKREHLSCATLHVNKIGALV